MEVRKTVFRIQVKKYEKPFSNDADDNLEWICRSLGFLEPIDKDKTAYSIFREILINAQKDRLLSSTELSRKVKMSRGSVINHLNRLQTAGLVMRQGKYYVPRSKSVFRMIQELEEDLDRIFKRMEETAKRLDRDFGFDFDE